MHHLCCTSELLCAKKDMDTKKENIKRKQRYSVAVIQMKSKLFDTWTNLARAVEFVEEAAKEGADLICLPEGFLTGYDADRIEETIVHAEPIDGNCMQTMMLLARENKVHILVPFFARSSDGVRNSAFLIDDEGKVVCSYSKTHLIGTEKGNLQPGNLLPVWDTKLGKIGILICYDACFPETARVLAMKGAELILVPSAWRTGSYFSRWWKLDLSCRALDNLVYVAAPNLTGPCGEDGAFAGLSRIIEPTGDILAGLDETEEGIAYSNIDLRQLKKERSDNTVLDDIRKDLYSY